MTTHDTDFRVGHTDEDPASWQEEFRRLAGNEKLDLSQLGVQVGEAYPADFTPDEAVADLKVALSLQGLDDVRYEMYEAQHPALADLRIKLVSKKVVSLSEIMPHLAALGVEVMNEFPYEWEVSGEPVWMYDFGFKVPEGQQMADWTEADRARFVDAFHASYTDVAEAGRMTRLVMAAHLSWRQVEYLRAIGHYLRQANIPFSQTYVAAALNGNPQIAAALVDAFETKFDPARSFASLEERRAAFDAAVAGIETALDAVASLDHDRILRMYLKVLKAMLRTNAFAADRPALAFKLAPRELDLLPEPRPKYEIFVYSPVVEGVHLRFGDVARGGLRWSDRAEDFRTEVLGLVKAQMVKNTVIVPTGAKGGFVPQRLPDPAVDRAGWADGGLAAYQLFVNTLLSLTDNIVDGAVVPPADVIRYDGDDPYLVVAADKGTAKFSDYANAIAVERGFWLGDAFASGGSAGYDHKGMGITARGAWESVKRHFFEMGKDCQTEDFTCVGIGDMAGDVFGNGMMLSEHTLLVAAFNHQHIFLDPHPDAAASFAERVRLFNLPRSAWSDYNPELISAGGGVFERSAKSIPISPEVREVLGLPDGTTKLTPNEVINAILKAPVDLLWNGGIGTYVKASTESHADAGDKANDAVRVNGAEVRAKIAGEGGNLGWTQLGRIEYAQNGGRVNTDFIDNSAGVDTSDHEVNIKILLTPEVAAGRMTMDERNELLASMTDEVAEHVLRHNIDQNLALAAASYHAAQTAPRHEAWMRELEQGGYLDRRIEFLPSSAEMERRIGEGRGLTRPELSTLLAYTKIRLADLLLESSLPDDPYLADRLVTYFPKALRERFAEGMARHRLRREIVTTVTVNRFVNSQGITSFQKTASETGAGIEQIIRAQLAVRNIMQVARFELDLPKAELNGTVDAAARVEIRRMVERGIRWLLNNRRETIDIVAESEFFGDGVRQVMANLPELLSEQHHAQFAAEIQSLVDGGLAQELATATATARYAHLAFPIVEIAKRLGRDVMTVASVMFAVSPAVGADALFEKLSQLPLVDRWDLMAQSAMRADLQKIEADLTAAVLEADPAQDDPQQLLATWRQKAGVSDAELAMLAEIGDGPADLARISVALRMLRSLLG